MEIPDIGPSQWIKEDLYKDHQTDTEDYLSLFDKAYNTRGLFLTRCVQSDFTQSGHFSSFYNTYIRNRSLRVQVKFCIDCLRK